MASEKQIEGKIHLDMAHNAHTSVTVIFLVLKKENSG